MSRPVSKGMGIHRTIYFPIEMVQQMGAAMAAKGEPTFNRFVCDAVKEYCDLVLMREKEGAEHGKEEV